MSSRVASNLPVSVSSVGPGCVTVVQIGHIRKMESLYVVWHCGQCRVKMDVRVTNCACLTWSVMLLGMLRTKAVWKSVVLWCWTYFICSSL